MIKNNHYSITDYINSYGKKPIRYLSKILYFSKSAIHRHQIKVAKRSAILGAEFFETAKGQQWILHFVAAAILIFGIVAGIGSDRIALFMSLIGLCYFAALSADSLRKIENNIDDLIIKYKDEYDAMVKAKAAEIEITPGADETYLSDFMCLVLMDLQSGFIFTEEIEERRDHKTWALISTPWITSFKVVRCFLSDKAKALIKLADKTFNTARIPDLFHMMYDISNVMRFSFNRIQKQLESELKKLHKKASKAKSIKGRVAAIGDEISSVIYDKKTYQKHLRRLSLKLHPFKIVNSAKQISETVSTEMKASLSVIKGIKEKREISDPRNKIKRVEKQIPGAAKQIDLWWGWVETSLDGLDIAQDFKDWLMLFLLPSVYWEKQINKTDSKIIKYFYKLSYRKAEAKLFAHRLTKMHHPNPKWLEWSKNMADIFIRTTSAIEGRNGWLSQLHFNGRGLTSNRLKSQTGIHNYFLLRDNGTTACERLSGIKPECLFKYIVANLEPLSAPRIGKNMKLLGTQTGLAVPP